MKMDQVEVGMVVQLTRGPFRGCTVKVMGFDGRRVKLVKLKGKRHWGTVIPSHLKQIKNHPDDSFTYRDSKGIVHATPGRGRKKFNINE